MATAVALVGGGSAGAGTGVATVVDDADGVAATDFAASVGPGDKSTKLISHTTATTTTAATPTPSIAPRDDAIVDGSPRDDNAAS